MSQKIDDRIDATQTVKVMDFKMDVSQRCYS